MPDETRCWILTKPPNKSVALTVVPVPGVSSTINASEATCGDKLTVVLAVLKALFEPSPKLVEPAWVIADETPYLISWWFLH